MATRKFTTTVGQDCSERVKGRGVAMVQDGARVRKAGGRQGQGVDRDFPEYGVGVIQPGRDGE